MVLVKEIFKYRQLHKLILGLYIFTAGHSSAGLNPWDKLMWLYTVPLSVLEYRGYFGFCCHYFWNIFLRSFIVINVT